MSAAANPDIERMSQELQESKAEVERMRNALRAAPATTQAPPQNLPTKQDLETAFFKDPLGFSAAIATHAASNNPSMDTLIEVARREARGEGEDAEIFDKYYTEIEQQVASLAPQFRTNVHVWRNAFRIVAGAHMRDILNERRGSVAPAIRIKDGPAAPNTREASAPSPIKLTPEQENMARQLHLTPDEYRHGMEVLEKQASKGPSPWDEVITIDNVRRGAKKNVNVGAK